MKIIVECECGNNATLKVRNKKQIVVRDNLEKESFSIYKNEISESKIYKNEISESKEYILKCSKCGAWINLYVD